MARRITKAKYDLSAGRANMLDLSTAHASARDLEIAGDLAESMPRTIPHQYGVMLVVSSEGVEDAAENLRERGHSRQFINLYKSAAAAPECYMLINFDCDARILAGLPTYEH